MKLLFAALSLSFCVVFVNGWVGSIPFNPEEFAEHNISTEDVNCFSKSHGLNTMSIGEEKPFNESCGIAKCVSDRTIYLTGCWQLIVVPPCRVGPGNLSKPYPDCCFEIICPKDITDNKL